MNLQSLLNQQPEDKGPRYRSRGTIIAYLLADLAGHKSISGDTDAVLANFLLNTEFIKNVVFADAISLVAEHMLKLFPEGDTR